MTERNEFYWFLLYGNIWEHLPMYPRIWCSYIDIEAIVFRGAQMEMGQTTTGWTKKNPKMGGFFCPVEKVQR
jgi:hypothetical protein